jgi:hypothetical protein
MKIKWMMAAGLALLVVGSGRVAAQSLNPVHWMKKSPTASEQLSADKDAGKKLESLLQAILPPKTKLDDACASFKQLETCVAALHISHNLKIKFNCVKWDVTGTQPTGGNVATCTAPENGKALSLVKAIQTLKPEADAKAEAKNAERRAREDIKDANS